ncbi:MAG: aminoacyl-tRNA hydrolase [Clostridia bacterium]
MLIIGLGNVGLKYKGTYHNMGFEVLDKLAKKLNTKFTTTECKSKTAVVYLRGQKIILAKPTTFMNLSGEAVRELIGKYKKDATEFIVIYDDIDIPVGTLRLRTDGSGGTHNGMKNIIECINTKEFKRIRVGTGFDRGEVPLVSVVLSKVCGENKKLIDGATDRACDALMDFVDGMEFERVMQQFNG